jgi:KDO2-lipid IV(A) lauroyltransferase
MQSLLQALPWPAGRAGARLLGDLAYVLDRARRQENALANLQRALPSLERDEAKRVLKGVYRHFAESILDGVNFARFAGRRGSDELLEAVGFEKLQTVPRDAGVIFVSGHFGHWELLGTALPLLGYPLWTVARPLRNPLVYRHVRRLREATGQHLLPKRGALRRIIRLLRRGENVGFLIDQDVRQDGIFVDFFGKPASTTPIPAKLAIRTGAPLAFVYAHRVAGKNRFRLVLKDVFLPRQTDPAEVEVPGLTQEITSELEETIRQAPEEWLWLHRRWKTYPGKYGSN